MLDRMLEADTIEDVRPPDSPGWSLPALRRIGDGQKHDGFTAGVRKSGAVDADVSNVVGFEVVPAAGNREMRRRAGLP